ncbi:suppressor of cytokine signaling 3-like [Stigmatopora nigra]
MVASRRREPLAVSVGASTVARSDWTPHHFKPFSSHAHYQQVMCALGKLQKSGFYWGAVGGREAGSLLRPEPPGTFLIRDSSDNRHFFTLSVQTPRGTKNLRVHSELSGFFLQPDAQCAQEPPRFDCVLKLIAHYMGKCPAPGPAPSPGPTAYLIHSGGERIPLELRRPLFNSLLSLKHMCRRTLNSQGLGGAERLPNTLRDFLEEYDAPI